MSDTGLAYDVDDALDQWDRIKAEEDEETDARRSSSRKRQ